MIIYLRKNICVFTFFVNALNSMVNINHITPKLSR